MGFFWGLLSAVGYGSADLLARFSSRQIGAIYTLYYMQFVGLIGLGGYLLLSGELARTWTQTRPGDWLLAVGVGVINITGALALYQALRIGKASVVSPIVSSYSALIVPIALLAGERLAPLALLGLIVVIIGVILSSQERERESVSTDSAGAPRRLLAPGIGWALLSALCFTVAFSLYGFVVIPVLGGLVPVWISRVTCVILLTIVFTIRRRGFHPPPNGRVWVAVLALGALDTIGFVAFMIGSSGDQVALVSVLSSLFAAVTVLLARLFLDERMRPIQWAGVAAIFIGLIAVSLPAT